LSRAALKPAGADSAAGQGFAVSYQSGCTDSAKQHVGHQFVILVARTISTAGGRRSLFTQPHMGLQERAECFNF